MAAPLIDQTVNKILDELTPDVIYTLYSQYKTIYPNRVMALENQQVGSIDERAKGVVFCIMYDIIHNMIHTPLNPQDAEKLFMNEANEMNIQLD